MSKRILALIPEPHIARLVEVNLQLHEFVVDVARSVLELAQMAKTLQPDLIVLDMGFGSLLALEAIRSSSDIRDMKVLMLLESRELLEETRRWHVQADLYMIKPLDPLVVLYQARDMMSRPVKYPQSPLVIVVDDEPHVLKLIHSALERQGFSVITASDGGRALDLIPTHKPDLLVIDSDMPGIDGFKLLKIIKQISDTLHIPVILMLNRQTVFQFRQKFVAVADCYVTKPFNPMELILVARRILSDRQSEK